MYSNSYCNCSFESEIIKIGQSSHKMYSNNIRNFQEFTTILNAHTKKPGNLSYAPCIYILSYYTILYIHATRGVMVVIIRNGHGNTSSDPG